MKTKLVKEETKIDESEELNIKKIMIKNKNNMKKESWEWRCFHKEEKLSNSALKLVDLNLPKPKHINYTDQYVIIPKLTHNIKLRETKDQNRKELHIKTITKAQNNIFKFSRKSILSFPIMKKDLLILKRLNILNENNETTSIDSIKNIFDIKNDNSLLCFVKKNITRYNIKKDISKFKKDLRLEFANIYINNAPFKTISLKCTSKTVIIEMLRKLDMLDLERTNYVNYIKSLEKK